MAFAAIRITKTMIVLSTSSSLHRQVMDPTKWFLGRSFYKKKRIIGTKTTIRRRLSGTSSDSKPEEEEENKKNIGAFSSPEDVSYLWKLGAGSVGGAVVIKYGSVLFPAITTPNILQALIMIMTPMLVAVLLLINQSKDSA